MRKLTDHIVRGDQAVQLNIEVVDDPGAGGANHEYRIRWDGKPKPLPTVAELEEILAQPVETAARLLPDGTFSANGVCGISFQNGPIAEVGVNGITQEALLAIVIDRLRSFQAGPYACDNNDHALQHCELALHFLQRRTVERINRGVEGTHQK